MSQYQNIRANIILHLFRVLILKAAKFYFLIAEYGIFVISVNKINGKLWGDDIINSLICIKLILTVQEMFCWKLRKFKISYLPYFKSDLQQIFSLLIETFYSSYWNKLNLDWISPLKCVPNAGKMIKAANLTFCGAQIEDVEELPLESGRELNQFHTAVHILVTCVYLT